MFAIANKACETAGAVDPYMTPLEGSDDIVCRPSSRVSVPWGPFGGVDENGVLNANWVGNGVDTTKYWPAGTEYCGGSPMFVKFVNGTNVYNGATVDRGLFIDSTHAAWDAVMMVFTVHDDIFRLERKVNVNMLEGTPSTYPRPPDRYGRVFNYTCGYNAYPIYFRMDWKQAWEAKWLEFATGEYGCGPLVGFPLSKGVDMTSVAPTLSKANIKTRSEHLAKAVYDARNLMGSSMVNATCRKSVFEVVAMDLFCGHLAKVEYAVGVNGIIGIEFDVARKYDGTAYTYNSSAYACATTGLASIMDYHPGNDETERGIPPGGYGYAWEVIGGFRNCDM